MLAGTLGKMQARKITRIMRYAMKVGVPVVAFKDSGGARIQEGVDALSGYGDVFYSNVLLSGVVPQIAVICGPCAGGGAYSPAPMDFVIMTRKNSYMCLTGPEVIKAVTGRTTTIEEIGSAEMHASVSGNAQFIAEDDQHAIALVKHILSYLQSNNTEDPPHNLSTPIQEIADRGIDDLIPSDPSEPLDMQLIIRRLVDNGELLEVHANFARNIIVGFARYSGVIVSIVANQPMVMAGALDLNAADKVARFVRTCNVFNIPLVTLVDVPGFLPGVEEERGGIIRHGAKMLFAFASCTTPKITVILRKSYGGSYLAMCSQELGADMVFAWPTAEIAVMGADAAVQELTDVTSQLMPKFSAAAPALAAKPSPAASPSPVARAPAGSGDQCAEMSGVVASVLVKQGQSVNEGDRILELEAMKMKVPVIASRSGSVSRILVNVGDGVETGQALVSLA